MARRDLGGGLENFHVRPLSTMRLGHRGAPPHAEAKRPSLPPTKESIGASALAGSRGGYFFHPYCPIVVRDLFFGTGQSHAPGGPLLTLYREGSQRSHDSRNLLHSLERTGDLCLDPRIHPAHNGCRNPRPDNPGLHERDEEQTSPDGTR